MNLFNIVGSIGGILFILLMVAGDVLKQIKKKRKMKHPCTKQKLPMGFYTEKERAEIMAKMAS